MSLRIICLGKTKEDWLKDGIAEYRKRLSTSWKVPLTELDDVSLKTAGSVSAVKDKEAIILTKAIQTGEYVIALDERGTAYSSVDFSTFLQDKLAQTDIVFVIGGVYGLAETFCQRADLLLSLSAFTFSHQMVRLILMEQLYRAWTISAGKTYHY